MGSSENAAEQTIGRLIESLADIRTHHARNTSVYRLLQDLVRPQVELLFRDEEPISRVLGPIGEVVFPYRSMGAIDSLNLFELDELILFSFYSRNRTLYHRALDLGANIGLHAIVLSALGYHVTSYEPDPTHFEALQSNMKRNAAANVQAICAATSVEDGESEFVRVLGNTTGSHLAGSKANPYGELDRFSVKIVNILPEIEKYDLVKMDIEGHEAIVLCQSTTATWASTDAFVEIENPQNATAVFEHMERIGVGLFAQKTGWERVRSIEEMPTSYREGSVFVSRRDVMPWKTEP